MHTVPRPSGKSLDHRFRTAIAAARCWRDAERQARQKGLYFREVQCRAGVERCLKEARGIRAQMRAELGGVAA